MTRTVISSSSGLGYANWVPIVAAIAGSVGGAVATRFVAGSGKPSRKDVEQTFRLQQEAEIQRMAQAQQFQQAQTEQLGQYLLPAVGILALVMLLR